MIGAGYVGEQYFGGESGAGNDLTAGGNIASEEAFGVGQLSYVQDLTAGGGIATLEAFGVGLIVGGNELTLGGGITSAEAFGIGSIAVALTDGGAIVSAEAFGAGTLRVRMPPPFSDTELWPAELVPPDDPAFEEALRRGTSVWNEPELEIFITSHPLADTLVERRMYQYSNLELVHPFRDSRTCKFVSNIEDINSIGQSNVRHLQLPFRRWMKVLYRGYLIFWGPLLKPRFGFKNNTIEVNAHDTSIYWKRHDLSGADEAIDGVPVNGEGLWTVADAANLTGSEAGDDILGPAIVKESAQVYLLPGETERLRQTPELGANVYETIQDISGREDGPDWELVPIDQDHDHYEVWTPGMAAAFRAREEIGRELEEKVLFQYGFGHTNLDDFEFEPEGESVRNRWISQNQAGAIRVAKYLQGMRECGILEGYERAPGDNVDPDGLAEIARAQVLAYGEAIPTFKIYPTWDKGKMGSAASTPWRYPSGYRPGDRIRAQAKKGDMFVDLVGRITEVTLKQVDADENVVAEIECIPDEVQDINVTVDETV